MGLTGDDAKNRVRYVLSGRPHFFDDPAIDKLLAMTMALLGEVCVLRDRLDTHERLAASHGRFGPSDVDRYEPDDEAMATRQQTRKATVDRVMKVLTEEVARLRDE